MQTISNALQAAAAIKSNLYDDSGVQIEPQVFAFKAPTVDAENENVEMQRR